MIGMESNSLVLDWKRAGTYPTWRSFGELFSRVRYKGWRILIGYAKALNMLDAGHYPKALS